MTEPTIVPEWVCTLVGRLVLDNEAMRQRLVAMPPPFVDMPVDETTDADG